VTDDLTPAAADALRRAHDALERIRQAVEIQGKAADDRAVAIVDLVEALGRGGRKRAQKLIGGINLSRLDTILKDGRKVREQRATGTTDTPSRGVVSMAVDHKETPDGL
jgi:hypothetical protein